MRQLVSYRTVKKIEPIKGADRIELAFVDGWQCVVKKGSFAVGDVGVYFEVDSLLPDVEPYNDIMRAQGLRDSEIIHPDGTTSMVQGYVVRTVRFKKKLAQGLLLPLSEIPGLNEHIGCEGPSVDLAEFTGVRKYERPIPDELRGKIKGYMPGFLKRTDQERVQNLQEEVWDLYQRNVLVSAMIKLNGTSLTVYRHAGERGVCSKELDMLLTEPNIYVVEGLKIHKALTESPAFNSDGDYCLQAEIVGPNVVAGNPEGLATREVYMYNVYDIASMRPFPVNALLDLKLHNLKHVPFLNTSIAMQDLVPNAQDAQELTDGLLLLAEGPGALGAEQREGLVIRTCDGQFSFKVISNKYLLSED